MRSLSLRAKLHILANSNNNISKALLTYFAFSCFWTFQKHQMKLFRASAHDRNTKWNFFMLLHTSETPNETFSRFCTRQKHQMKLFHASARDRNTKWNFSCFCTRQKHQMKLFHASAHDRNTKWKFFVLLHTTETPNETFSCFCTWQKHQMEIFRDSERLRKSKWRIFVLLHASEKEIIVINRQKKIWLRSPKR